jgi:hypothetical protein
MFTELAHIEGLLAETYRGRIQYEMLHNSDDAGATVVDVALGSDGSVTWVKNGRPYWRVVTGRDFAISNRRTPWPDLESNSLIGHGRQQYRRAPTLGCHPLRCGGGVSVATVAPAGQWCPAERASMSAIVRDDSFNDLR